MTPRSSPITDALLREAPFVHRLARALLADPDLARDLAQDTMLAALSAPPDRAVRDRRSWLAGITRHLATSQQRDRARRTRHEARAAKQLVGDHEARTDERLRLHHRLSDAVMTLPEPYRTTVRLRFFDDLPPRRIARQLQIQSAAVRQRLRRGLALLRERLDHDAGGRAAWLLPLLRCGEPDAGAFPLLVAPILMKKLLLTAASLLVLASVSWVLLEKTVAEPAPGAPTDRTGPSVAVAELDASPSRAGSPADVDPSREVVGFRVHVTSANGAPQPGATVHRWRDRADVDRANVDRGEVERGDVATQRTDQHGDCGFAGIEGPGGVLVTCEGHAPRLVVVARLRDTLAVELGQGAALAGTLLVDGAPAAQGLRLQLSHAQLQPPITAPAALASILAEQTGHVVARTRDDGTFSAMGLPADWSGSLTLPRTHWLLPRQGQPVEDEHLLLLAAPQTGLLLESTQLPTLRGRVVWEDDGAGVPGAHVFLSQVRFADGTTAPSLGDQADDEGRFTLGLYPSSPHDRDRWLDPLRRSALVHVKVAAYSSNVTLDAADGPLDLSQEVQVRVRRPAQRWYRAITPEGQPVAGACADAINGGVGIPTDADGLGCVLYDLPLVANPFQVGAPGRQIVRVTPSGQDGGSRNRPIEVMLPQANGLRITVRSADGGPVEDCQVLWRGKPQLFPAGRGMPSDLHRRFGNTDATGFLEPVFRPDPRGVVILHSITPEVSGALVVTDRLGTELSVVEQTTPALGEVRDLLLVVQPPQSRVHGRVVDAFGSPVVQASVRLTNQAGTSLAASSAADGSFAFAPTVPTGLTLSAHRAGFAPAQRALDAAETLSGVILTLDRGRSVEVSVLDEADSPVPDLRLQVETATKERRVAQRGDGGRWIAVDLPPGEVTFACEFGGRRFEVRHDTASPRSVLRVARPAMVTFLAPQDGASRQIALRRVAMLTRLDEPAGADALDHPLPEPLFAEVDEARPGRPPTPAAPFVPGRYRVTLASVTWRDGKNERTAIGPPVEVELRAGETTRVPLPQW